MAYTSTKHAITGLTRRLALDGRAFDICCGQIDIGNAATDMTAAMASGVRQAGDNMRAKDRMHVHHVAGAVLQMGSLPLSANVLVATFMASRMPFVGRGWRKPWYVPDFAGLAEIVVRPRFRASPLLS